MKEATSMPLNPASLATASRNIAKAQQKIQATVHDINGLLTDHTVMGNGLFFGMSHEMLRGTIQALEMRSDLLEKEFRDYVDEAMKALPKE
jgi:hypothetical protein